VDDEVGFDEAHDVTITDSGAPTLCVFDAPKGLIRETRDLQLVEFIVSELTATEGPPEYKQAVFDADGGVGSTVGGDAGSSILEALYFFMGEFAEEGIGGNDVFDCVNGWVLPVSPTAPPKIIARSLPMGVKV
jgi:hypothetical protein